MTQLNDAARAWSTRVAMEIQLKRLTLDLPSFTTVSRLCQRRRLRSRHGEAAPL
jgi:hypothetical protein